MTQTEIKKALYKEKPIANRLSTAGGFVWYEARVKVPNQVELKRVTFKVPKEEAFSLMQSEPAQLLIRWICDE